MKKNTLVNLSKQTAEGFIDKVKKRYVEKYADDTVKLLEDQRKLQSALDKINSWVKRVEEGDLTAVEEYVQGRKRLESEELSTF